MPGADEIQQMLIARLEKQIADLQSENETLSKKLRDAGTESAARIYLLEEERDQHRRDIAQLEKQLNEARGELRAISRLSLVERKKR